MPLESWLLIFTAGLIIWAGVIKRPRRCFTKLVLDWNSAAPAAAALIAVAISFAVSANNLELSKKQTALQLRPFIGVIKPSFSFPFEAEGERYWLKVEFFVHNFGKNPANEYVRKNDKVMVISLVDELLQELEGVLKDPNANTTHRDVAKQKVIDNPKTVIKEVYEYLRKNPDAQYTDINKLFGGKGVHCYGDIREHFPQPTILLPEQTQPNRSNRDFGPNNGHRIAAGSDILVYYVSLSYEGATVGETYSTFFIGYYSEIEDGIYRGQPRPNAEIKLREYKQWSERVVL